MDARGPKDRRSGEVAFAAAEGLRRRTVSPGEDGLATTAGPRFSRRQVGEEIRRLRVAADLSQGQLGKKVRASGARISRLETGETQPDLALVMNILETLEVDEELSRTLILIAREANEQMWWKTSGLPDRQKAVAELENTSNLLRVYSAAVIHGLLQTPRYMEVRYTDREASREIDIPAAIDGRQERQKILTRKNNPLKYLVVIEENVIRRPTAPEVVMREQRRHIVEMASLPNVEIRVLPYAAELAYFSPPMTSFELFAVSETKLVAAVEIESVETQITDEMQVERYRIHFDRLLAASLSPSKSIDLIEGVDI